MKALVVAASPDAVSPARLAELAAGCDVVIACDGGAQTLAAAGVTPTLAVGDFDSLSVAELERLSSAGVRIARYPIQKDATDFDLALDEARALGANVVEVVSATGGTPDHTLAVFGTLVRNADLQPTLHGPGWWGIVLAPQGRDRAEVAPGATFSIVALTSPATVTCRGARWNLEGAKLQPLASLGVGNLAEEAATVTVHDGCVLVVVREAGE